MEILNLSKSSDDICSTGDESNSVSFKLEPVIKTSSISWESSVFTLARSAYKSTNNLSSLTRGIITLMIYKS